MPPYSTDGIDVLLTLLRSRMTVPGVTVVSRMPDELPSYVPLVLVRRTGGQSRAPRFFDDFLVNVQCFAGGVGVHDPGAVAYELAEDVRRVLWEALLHQHVTPAGWIVDVRESSAPEELPDSDMPLFSRFVAVYDLRIRRPVGN